MTPRNPITINRSFDLTLLLLFSAVLGITGAITTLIVYPLALTLCLYVFVVRLKDSITFLARHKSEKIYLLILLGFSIVALLLSLFHALFPPIQNAVPRYNETFKILFDFAVLPCIALALGLRINKREYRKVLAIFSIGTVISGFIVLFTHYHIWEFAQPKTLLANMFYLRLTAGGSNIPWIKVFLKTFSLYPAIGALFAFYLVGKTKRWKRFGWIIIFIINSFFLMVTVTRGVIIGFLVGFLFIAVFTFNKLSKGKKLLVFSIFATVIILIFSSLPDSFLGRFSRIGIDVKDFYYSGKDTTSVPIRLTIWQILLSHWKEYFIAGTGSQWSLACLYDYYCQAGQFSYIGPGKFSHHHNQYLSYLHSYGITGLLFLISLFVYPIFKMVQKKWVSPLLVAVILVFVCCSVEDIYISNQISSPLLFVIFFIFFQTRNRD
ncbi:MAG: O-antigen ligase family protein [Bacteroidales bacterium]|jgi:O-antigen ligase|nr:O-antigen ligase family protein [Bacteroidales bacterium]